MNKDLNDIDKLAKDAFDNFEADFNPDDWDRMEQKLNKKEHLMPYIWLYKGTEAFIFILIIFTAFNLWNYYSDKKADDFTSGKEDSALQQSILADQQLSQQNISKADEKLKQQTSNLTQNDNSQEVEKLYAENNQFSDLTNALKLNNNGNAELTNKAEQNSKSTLSNSYVNSTTKSARSNISLNENRFSSNDNANTSFNNEFKGIENSLTNDENSFVSTMKSNQLNFDVIRIAALSSVNTKINPGDGVEEGKGFGFKTNFKFPKLYRRQMRAVLFAGADINFNNSLGQSNFGFSASAQIEQEISDRFAIRAGLQVSRKSFENDYTKEYSNPFVEDTLYTAQVYQKTSLTMISMPIFFNTLFYRDEKWRIGLSTGVAFGMLTNRYVSGTQRTTIAQAAGSITNISQLNGNSFEKGFLQGGSSAQNFFISAAIGADIERQLGDHTTLFIQPIFGHNLNRISTAKESYGQLSLNAGIKTVIK